MRNRSKRQKKEKKGARKLEGITRNILLRKGNISCIRYLQDRRLDRLLRSTLSQKEIWSDGSTNISRFSNPLRGLCHMKTISKRRTGKKSEGKAKLPIPLKVKTVDINENMIHFNIHLISFDYFLNFLHQSIILPIWLKLINFKNYGHWMSFTNNFLFKKYKHKSNSRNARPSNWLLSIFGSDAWVPIASKVRIFAAPWL